jgi:ABC-type branched-subunit amino acid transport system substrate-binding protein
MLMAIDEQLPPACAFAVSVLEERDLDPDSVPEEAVEAAQHHMATCPRCLNAAAIATRRKKKKVRRAAEPDYPRDQVQDSIATTKVAPPIHEDLSFVYGKDENVGQLQATPIQSATQTQAPEAGMAPLPRNLPVATPLAQASPQAPLPGNNPLTCLECRQQLHEYAEAMDSGQNVETLYPEMYDHLLDCESGCLVLLDLFRQEAKASRKYRRRPVRSPFSAIGWELTGFFRGGQVPMSPMALAYGTLMLLLIVASLATYLSIRWDDARYYHPPIVKHTIPTPDGIGLSDGLNIYDACNTSSYQYKREAAQDMQQNNFSRADSMLASATSAVSTDTTGCNGAEAAIYREDLHVRQSGRTYGVMVVSFDSGPGNANPDGGTNRHILYAPYTQELVGAFIAQQLYNTAQMQISGAPLLYLVLANTTGVEQGALQIANSIASLSSKLDYHQFGLLAQDNANLLAVLGLGPSSLVQVVLPVFCRAGVPLIAPTSTGVFVINLLAATSLYRHCAPGFAFIRFSPDDAAQSQLAANYAYDRLRLRRAAVFYDPSNPSSTGSAGNFINTFSRHRGARIVAQETAVASGLLDANGRPQASRDDLLAGLNDALKAKPNLIYAPLLTNDVITLAQSLAQLPANQQPVLLIGGEFVQPSALQGLVPWARQQQLSLPHIYVAVASAARPPTNWEWQKQFYASFCTSFATPGNFCSGAATLDQAALLFGDGIKIVGNGIGPVKTASQFPTAKQLVLNISKERFQGVSCPIALRLWDNVLLTSTQALPVILGMQQDGSVQIVG